MQFSNVQRFVRIDIADPGDKRLIQQQRFERSAAPGDQRAELLKGERVFERFRAKFGQIVEFSELEEFLDRPIRTYSSGMVARLGFSVAVHLEPEILLVDELLDYLGNRKPVRRIWLSALDETSVRRALEGLRDNREYDRIKTAAELRQRGIRFNY